MSDCPALVLQLLAGSSDLDLHQISYSEGDSSQILRVTAMLCFSFYDSLHVLFLLFLLTIKKLCKGRAHFLVSLTYKLGKRPALHPLKYFIVKYGSGRLYTITICCHLYNNHPSAILSPCTGTAHSLHLVLVVLYVYTQCTALHLALVVLYVYTQCTALHLALVVLYVYTQCTALHLVLVVLYVYTQCTALHLVLVVLYVYTQCTALHLVLVVLYVSLHLVLVVLYVYTQCTALHLVLVVLYVYTALHLVGSTVCVTCMGMRC